MRKHKYLILTLVGIILLGCRPQYSPKPYGYFRIAIPDTAYTTFAPDDYPYMFNKSANAEIVYRTEDNEKYWLDIYYPDFKANIHCSYKPIKNNFSILTSEAEQFVYKHAQMASSIPEQGYENPEQEVYGVMYEIQGNTASPYQFVLTDSTRHFFRGALYFNCTPNQDSLAPVIDYMHKDIIELIESFRWQK